LFGRHPPLNLLSPRRIHSYSAWSHSTCGPHFTYVPLFHTCAERNNYLPDLTWLEDANGIQMMKTLRHQGYNFEGDVGPVCSKLFCAKMPFLYLPRSFFSVECLASASILHAICKVDVRGRCRRNPICPRPRSHAKKER
jgi:hypothetical protein